MTITVTALDYDKYFIEYEGLQLHMTRAEMEQLFVDMGHCLQDQDIVYYDESGETDPQPEGIPYDDNNTDRVTGSS